MNRDKLYINYLILSISIGFIFQMLYLDAFIIEQHGFRQTQTAITVFWYLKDGVTFPYLTPVFGFPWSAPFEFPSYQLVVYGVCKFFAIDNIDLVGRIVSLVFYYLSLIISYKILMKLGVKRASIFIVLIVITLSPLYIFWSRTFMIESTALFFTLSFLYFSLLLKERFNFKSVSLLIIFAILASLTKITTFLVGLIFIFFYIIIDYRNIFNRNNIIVVVIVIFSIFCGIYWTQYSDEIKMLNIIASQITSIQLTNWNFGTLEQRIDSENYLRLIERTFKHGSIGILFALLVLFKIKIYSYRNIILISLFTYVLSIAILFNLYVVHSYYLYANMLFLLIGVGLVLSTYLETITSFRKLNYILIFFIFISVVSYYSSYFKKQKKNLDNVPEIQIAKIIKEHLSAGDVIYIKGLDWSSIIPYYSQRKAIMIPEWSKIDIGSLAFDELLQKSMRSKNKLGALVLCNQDETSIFERVKYFKFEDANQYEFEQCSLYIK